MKEPELTPQYWKPCPPTMLGKMVQRQRQLTRRQALANLAIASASIGALLISGSSIYRSLRPKTRSMSPQPVVALTCSAVLPLLDQYCSGKMDCCMRRQVDLHLANCPGCTAVYHCMVKQA